MHLNNVQDSFVQNNNFSSNIENIRYSDKSKATARITTINNNLVCFSAGAGPSNLLLNKPASSNVSGGSAGTSPSGANDGDSTDPTKTFYFGQVRVGDWWKVDTGSSQTLNALVVYSWATNYNDIPHRFHIETSTTGSFTGEQLRVVTELGWDLGNPPKPRFRIYTFPNVTARYVRFVSDIDQPWTHLQEIEAYNDPNINNTYSPDTACNYNFYNNLASSTTTNLNDNYWEFAPNPNIEASVFDNQDDSTNGITQFSSRLSVKAPVFGDSALPSISITQPANGATISGSSLFSVNTADSNGIRKVSYFVDNIFLGESFLSPFSVFVNSKKITNSTHTLLAIVEDLAGNINSTSRNFSTNNNLTFDTTPPTNPTNLSASLTTGGSNVTVNFSPSTDSSGQVSYLIKRNAKLVAVINNTTYQEPLQNTADIYSVIAVDASDNFSEEVGPVEISNGGSTQKEGDFNNDGFVNSTDLAILISTWGSTTDLRADTNNDGIVSSTDLARLIAKWGS